VTGTAILRAARGLAAAIALAWAAPAHAMTPVETPMLAADVAAGKLPPVAERLPAHPLVWDPAGDGSSLGQPGGDLHMLVAKAQDVRLLVVYGYARLVGYDKHYQLSPDILEKVDVEEGRIFTLHLRPGHRWSDGAPFTSEDFRYWWEDVANDAELSPGGVPEPLLVEGNAPEVTFPDAVTVRFAWDKPNPTFLPDLAAARPLDIYLPAHYLKRFHAKYADKATLDAEMQATRTRSWAQLHNLRETSYKFDNPDMPTLQPWLNTTRAPASRFVAVRNPYFHRVDAAGHQLPYIDRVLLAQADGRLIPAKAAAGEADLQARGLSFSNYTFLKAGAARNGYDVRLWRLGQGSQVALYPNLNQKDPVWAGLMRDARFRRALSLGIDRELINQSLYFGLAVEGNNTMLPSSPLYDEAFRTRWARYDRDEANRLLDALGLDRRDGEGIRLLPDGRPAEIVVETAGEDTEQTDVLELVRATWAEIGIKLFAKPSQRDVLRRRVASGDTQMAVWSGMDNGIATPDMSPSELAPTASDALQWPRWGMYFESNGKNGAAPDLPAAIELVGLYRDWQASTSTEVRRTIWRRMLEINADQAFSIGVVAGVYQPVLVSKRLRNVPQEATFSWDPGAQLGVLRPDTFWFAPDAAAAAAPAGPTVN
jgi:peptide/nickel transport system substrate-binding protein